ncbi:DUF7660 family protein [Hyalangium sp.]|uniref:DUF7660 family protein n=1 Tax=Hyalangium sp. TaxID=2028555 RepID=UPI002D5BE5A5|nr:hypothetical protein [Hyalangium sp.]HYI02784.1 hypothetical protein [Hyalangium sp.]
MERIRSNDDLVTFIRSLRADLIEKPDTWENPTLERFLEALAAWTEAMDGYYRNTGQEIPKQPSWKVVGDMLMAAKMYE